MAICPHCFTDKPAFSKNCPQCTHEVGFVGGIVFDLIYKAVTIAFFVFILWIFVKIFT
jgi:hypothetical protein